MVTEPSAFPADGSARDSASASFFQLPSHTTDSVSASSSNSSGSSTHLWTGYSLVGMEEADSILFEYPGVFLISSSATSQMAQLDTEEVKLPSRGLLYLTRQLILWIPDSHKHLYHNVAPPASAGSSSSSSGSAADTSSTKKPPTALVIPIANWILNRLSKASPKIKLEYSGARDSDLAATSSSSAPANCFCVLEFTNREAMTQFSTLLGDLRKRLEASLASKKRPLPPTATLPPSSSSTASSSPSALTPAKRARLLGTEEEEKAAVDSASTQRSSSSSSDRSTAVVAPDLAIAGQAASSETSRVKFLPLCGQPTRSSSSSSPSAFSGDGRRRVREEAEQKTKAATCSSSPPQTQARSTSAATPVNYSSDGWLSTSNLSAGGKTLAASAVASKRREEARLRRQEALLQQHRREVLATFHPELDETYKHLVKTTGILSDAEFWALHANEDLPYRPLPVSVANDKDFLIKPPVTETYVIASGSGATRSSSSSVVGGGGGGSSGGSQSGAAVGNSYSVSTDVNVTRDDLERILAEDGNLRAIYASVVPCRMSERDFWERFFQSRYFYEMIGKPLPPGCTATKLSLQSGGGGVRAPSSSSSAGCGEEEAFQGSGAGGGGAGSGGAASDSSKTPTASSLAELLQGHYSPPSSSSETLRRLLIRPPQPPCAADCPTNSSSAQVISSSPIGISPDIDLLSNEATRLPVGFGSVLGRNAMAGELGDDETVAQVNANCSRMCRGTLPPDRKRYFRTLFQRFNDHSSKILTPALRDSSAPDADRYFFSSVLPPSKVKLTAALTNHSTALASSSSSSLSSSAAAAASCADQNAYDNPLRDAVELEDLRALPTPTYSQLGVTRQQLLAHWTAAAESSCKYSHPPTDSATAEEHRSANRLQKNVHSSQDTRNTRDAGDRQQVQEIKDTGEEVQKQTHSQLASQSGLGGDTSSLGSSSSSLIPAERRQQHREWLQSVKKDMVAIARAEQSLPLPSTSSAAAAPPHLSCGGGGTTGSRAFDDAAGGESGGSTEEAGGGGGGHGSSSSSSGLSLQRYMISRSMFVYNTKLCQGEKALQLGGSLIDYESDVVDEVVARLERIAELLRHYYSTSITQIEKRNKLCRALEAQQPEIEEAIRQSRSAASKSLYGPLLDMLKQIRHHADQVKQFVLHVRRQHSSTHSRPRITYNAGPPEEGRTPP